MAEIQTIEPVLRDRYFPGLASLGLLRLDLPDPIAGGNKSFKLKYHLGRMSTEGRRTLVTLGGAFSNHIAAVAYAGKQHGITTIGIIRGEELRKDANSVLQFSHACGMQLHFVSREEYGQRYTETYRATIESKFPGSYFVPEGGGGEEGVNGCMEILSETTDVFDGIILPSGTGTTCEGIRRTLKPHQRVTGIDIVSSRAPYACGGYAKKTDELIRFMHEMKSELSLPLDFVYSGKALFALHRMTKEGMFAGKRVLFIHTGGYAFMPEEN